MYPARIRNLWLATSASAGASLSVGINSFDQRCIVLKCLSVASLKERSSLLSYFVIPTVVKRARVLSGPIHARFWREWADQRATGPQTAPHLRGLGWSKPEGPCV